MKHRLAMVAFLAALGLTFPAIQGCASWAHPAQWQDMDVEYDVGFPILWNAIKLTLIEKFHTIERERSAEGTLVTGWEEELNYLAGQGFREQAHIHAKKGEKGWRVYVRVVRQSNEEPIYTLESKHARWQAADDNESRAQYLVGLIHSKLKALVN